MRVQLNHFKIICRAYIHFFLTIVALAQIRRDRFGALDSGTTFLTKTDFLNARNKLYEEQTTYLTNKDFFNGQRLTTDELYNTNGRRISLYKQRYYHGDIAGKASWRLKRRKNIRRNGVLRRRKKWPNNRIPYVLSVRYSQRERAVLARAVDEYHKRTCVRFEARTTIDRDYLYIGKIDGCFSDVGRAGGRQELSLDDGCLEYDTAIHELMHAVGFFHEHERWDRDGYIKILWQNIDRDAYDQFGRVDLYESSYYGQPYDYFSIMHYDRMAFSKNGFDTVRARQDQFTPVVGMQLDFSQIDLNKINNMYNCNGIRNSGASPSVSARPPTVITHNPFFSTQTTFGARHCEDKATLCWRWVDRCRSYFYEQIMRQFCAKTCGFCFN